MSLRVLDLQKTETLSHKHLKGVFSGEIAKSVLGNLGVYFLQEVRETGCSGLSMSH